MKELKFISILLIFLVFLTVENKAKNPDVYLNIEQLIVKNGYKVELHEVVTNDGYILNMYRIPNGLNELQMNENKSNKNAVLIIHGQAGSPRNFILLGKKYASAFYFADNGYDVWLFCGRGTECQNSKHINLDWEQNQTFWNYSFHEVGLYDISASIDAIIKKTSQENIFTVCHSLGCNSLNILLSEIPEYNNKIKLSVNYAPVMITKGMDFGLFQMISYFSGVVKTIGKLLRVQQFMSPSTYRLLEDTLRKLCAEEQYFPACKEFLNIFGNIRSVLIEDDVVELAVGKLERISIKQVTHLLDNVITGEFRKYDYGPRRNFVVYGTKLPPKYNLSQCSVPTAFFYGETDTLALEPDITDTAKLFSNIVKIHKVGPEFVHLDFLLTRKAVSMVYKPTVKLFKEFNNIPITKLTTENN